MGRRRLGIALLVPSPVAEAVEGLRTVFGDPQRGRIVPHITLVPPVNVNDVDFGPAIERLRATAAARSPLVLAVGPVATFSSGRRVAYLAVGGPSLAELLGLRDAVHEPPLCRDEGRAFVPHVTVCADAEPSRVEAMIAAGTAVFEPAHFDTVHVLENVRDDDDVYRWHVIDGAPLRLPAVIGRGGLELMITAHEHRGILELVARRERDEVGRAVLWLPDGGPAGAGRARLVTIDVVDSARRMGIGAHLLAAAVSTHRSA